MTTEIGTGVYCSNAKCPHLKKNIGQRYIGTDGGRGGRWQCRICNQWTSRGDVT